MFLTGNSDTFCVFQLPSWTSRLPSRTRGCGTRCAQPRPARPMGRSSVGTEEHRMVWWGSLQGMSVGPRPPLIVCITFHPVLDGPGGIVSDYPAKRLSREAGGQVPLMIGTALDEGLFLSG